MRVLHVMEATIGGTRRHVVDVARGLRARGLDVHLAVSTLREPAFEHDLAELEREGCGVLRLGMVREISPARDAGHLRTLARHLEALRPDVVHTHSSKAGVLGRGASLATGIGVRVHTPHTFAFLFDAMFSGAKRRLFREIEGFFAGHTQVLVAVSESEGRTIEAARVAEPARIRVVANGIDPAPFQSARPLARAELGLSDAAPLAAVVGLCNVAKGQDLALEALREPGLESLQLVFAGDGLLRPSLEARARALGLEDRVRFLGFRDDVPSILAAADFALVPSRWEGMPYIVLEAMASARPVVATPVDGARDLVRDGETGFLARAIGAGAIAEACRALLARSPRERAELGERGRERLQASHTDAAMVDGLIEVYREVLHT